ncbi:MAG: gamma-glutamyl-gamma-aminobutyrate hydrolase family protein [Ilumatobacteraceae bacterium]
MATSTPVDTGRSHPPTSSTASCPSTTRSSSAWCAPPLAADVPLLAVCRGMQILNVALGGDLVQHIGTEDHWFVEHPVTLDGHSRLAAAIGTERPSACHSVHHQSIGRLGDGLTLVGRADDGMPEAMEVDGSDGRSPCSGIPRTPPSTTASSRPCSTHCSVR